jgi:hypothetical protein
VTARLCRERGRVRLSLLDFSGFGSFIPHSQFSTLQLLARERGALARALGLAQAISDDVLSTRDFNECARSPRSGVAIKHGVSLLTKNDVELPGLRNSGNVKVCKVGDASGKDHRGSP